MVKVDQALIFGRILMSKPLTSTAEILVHLVRAGTETQEIHLAEGSTVADLLRISGASTTNQAILINGVPIEEAILLVEGSVVTLGPSTSNPLGNEPWRQRITSFQDEETWQEYQEILKAQRRGPTDEEDLEA
jgi:sulfur carrier protein ThiS